MNQANLGPTVCWRNVETLNTEASIRRQVYEAQKEYIQLCQVYSPEHPLLILSAIVLLGPKEPRKSKDNSPR